MNFRPAQSRSLRIVVVLAIILTGAITVFTRMRRSSLPPRHIFLFCLSGLRTSDLDTYAPPSSRSSSSPVIDAIAGKGVLFEHDYAQSDSALFSQASVISSRFSSEIAPIHRRGYVLAQSVPTLPRVLWAHDWQTAIFCGNRALASSHGFHAGFNTNGCDPARGNFRDLLPRALAWTRAHHGQRTMVLIQGNDCAEGGGEVSQVDSQIGTFLSQLASEGMTRANSLFVIYSDYGHQPSSRRVRTPWQNLLPDHLHVPLIVWGEGIQRGRRYRGVVQNLDITPTVLGLLHLVPPARMRGFNRGPWLEADSPVSPPPAEALPSTVAFSESGGGLAAVITRRHELIAGKAPPGTLDMLERLQEPPDPSRFALFDLSAGGPGDADVSGNLVSDSAQRATFWRLQALLLAQQRVAKANQPVKNTAPRKLDPKLRRELEIHGYW